MMQAERTHNPLCSVCSMSLPPTPPPQLSILQGSQPAQLSSQPLDHRELFAVVNAWRQMAPNSRFRSLLAFTPQHRASYLQMLTIR